MIFLIGLRPSKEFCKICQSSKMVKTRLLSVNGWIFKIASIPDCHQTH